MTAEQKTKEEPKPSKEFLNAIKSLPAVDDEYEYYKQFLDAANKEREVKEVEKILNENPELVAEDVYKRYRYARVVVIERDIEDEEHRADRVSFELRDIRDKREQIIYEIGAKEGLSRNFIYESIYKRNPRQVSCLKGCGKQLTVYSKYEPDYKATCPECTEKEARDEHKNFQERLRKEAEVNPLIKYGHDINNTVPFWEISYEMERKRIESKSESSIESSALSREWSEEQKYIARNFKQQLPYKDRPADCNDMSEEQWWKHVYKRRLELKEKAKQRELDEELRHNSPTRQILRMLGTVYGGGGSGCECKAEYMRQGQFCPVCRLMVKVWEYTKNIFKDAAQGRSPIA